MSDRFLSRWSRLKRESGLASRAELNLPEIPEAGQKTESLPEPTQAPQIPAVQSEVNPAEENLPTEANLGDVFKDGGIKQFLNPKVDSNLRNKAFKTLFQLPELGVIDYLDVYMDDFNVYEKLDESTVNSMESARRLLARADLLSSGSTAVTPAQTQADDSQNEAGDRASVSETEPEQTPADSDKPSQE